MTAPKLNLAALRESAAWEHAVRFVFGGTICVMTGIVGQRWGVLIGGLFMAFPSVLPASLTLVKKHEGRAAATDDARGARLGAVALAAFGATVALLITQVPAPVAFIVASVVWLAAGTGLWFLQFGRR